jgi:hypothetical protein
MYRSMRERSPTTTRRFAVRRACLAAGSYDSGAMLPLALVVEGSGSP